MKDYTIEFVLDGTVIGSGTVFISNGKMDTYNLEDEFFATIRKNEKSLIAQAEEEMREEIINGLTKEQENVLREKHGKDYHGTDDDMPDAYEDWLMELTLEDLKHILKYDF